MDFLPGCIETGRNNMKDIAKMEKRMDFILGGIKTDRNKVRHITKMGKKMDDTDYLV